MVMDKDMAIASLAFPSIYYLPLMNTFVSSFVFIHSYNHVKAYWVWPLPVLKSNPSVLK